MKFNKGLIRDRKPIDLPSGAWSNARNVIMTKASTLSNEEGIGAFGDHPANLSPIGKLLLNQKLIIYSQDNVDLAFSEIGFLDRNGIYTTILRSELLGFTKEFPILKSEGQINYLGDEIIAWITANDSPKVLNITNLPFEVDINKELVDPLKINALNIFQKANAGVITVDSVNATGGSIPSGTVQFAMAYSNEGLSKTNIFNPTNPVPITPSSMSNFDKIQGAEASTNTSKSVSLILTELDNRFDFVHLYAVRRNAGTFTVEEVAKLPMGDTINYTYTGSESSTDVTLEELLVDRVNYNIAKAMTQVNDKLYLGNLTATIVDNLQEHFLNLVVNYTTTTLTYGGLPPSGIKAPKVIHSKSGFFPGEVYALYASARLTNGSVTPAYHIPGREVANISGYEGILNENAIINSNGTYQSIAESPVAGPFSAQEDYNSGARKYFQTRLTADNPNASTNMGFWENDTELYPEGFGALTGEKVRHHRFPEAHSVNSSLAKSQSLKTLGIVISGFDTFPPEILDTIDSIEIFYAKKDIANSLIIGQDVSRFENKELAAAEPFHQYFGGNWDLEYEDNRGDTGNTWASDGLAVSNITQIDKTRMRFNNFDLMNSKAGVTPNFVTFQYRFRTPLLSSTYNEGVRTGVVVESTIDGGDISDPNQRKTRFFMVLDYAGSDVSSLGPVTDIQYLKQVQSSKYVPANITIGDEINKLGNEHLLVEFPNTTNLPSLSVARMNVNYQNERLGFVNPSSAREEVYVYNLCQVRTDLFKSFTNQQLISCGVVIKDFEIPFIVYGGDTLVSECSYMDHSMVPTIRRESGGNYFITDEYYRGEDAIYQGVKVARRFLGYFRGNAGYRHINEGNPNSQFHSSANITSLFEDYRRDQPEEILYNEDYSFKNELISVYPYNPERQDAYKFPTRILRSLLQGRETVEIQWNGFLPGDYYEHQKNRGEIINLEADNDRLFIHCRHSLFITRSSDTLSGNEADITISSGDIFALPPRELITSDAGYAGLHSSFATKKCKLGYIFADMDQGKVFLVNDGIEEISSYGLRNFFIENLPSKFNSQNDVEVEQPYQQFGIIIEYDERFNRILLVKKDLTLVNPELLDLDSESPTINNYYFRNGKLTKYNGGSYVSLPDEEFTDRGFTLSYYPGSPGIWLAFHDYSPDIFLNNRFRLLSYKSDSLFEHNNPVREFYGESYRSFVDFVFAEPNVLTKSLASISWQSEVINGSVSEQRSTFSSAIVYNSYQCSGEVVFDTKNISYVENEWRFNNFMDVVVDRTLAFMENFELVNSNINQSMIYYKQRKFIDKYFVLRLYFNNSLSKDIYIYDVNAKARPSAQ